MSCGQKEYNQTSYLEEGFLGIQNTAVGLNSYEFWVLGRGFQKSKIIFLA